MKRRCAFFVLSIGWLAACSPSNATSGDGGAGDGSTGGDGAMDAAAGLPNVNGGNLPQGYPNLALPQPGDATLRIVAPTVLELELVTTKAPDPAPVAQWNFVDASGAASALPPAGNFVVHAGGATVAVARVGFKRRPLYAPLARYDLRIGNYLYLVLASPIADGAQVSVDDSSGQLWSAPTPFTAAAE